MLPNTQNNQPTNTRSFNNNFFDYPQQSYNLAKPVQPHSLLMRQDQYKVKSVLSSPQSGQLLSRYLRDLQDIPADIRISSQDIPADIRISRNKLNNLHLEQGSDSNALAGFANNHSRSLSSPQPRVLKVKNVAIIPKKDLETMKLSSSRIFQVINP